MEKGKSYLVRINDGNQYNVSAQKIKVLDETKNCYNLYYYGLSFNGIGSWVVKKDWHSLYEILDELTEK